MPWHEWEWDVQHYRERASERERERESELQYTLRHKADHNLDSAHGLYIEVCSDRDCW
jgi:hypothetical protein